MRLIKGCQDFTIVILIMLLTLSQISASEPNEDTNPFVNFQTSSTIREGNIFLASITIRNLNENATLDIKKVTISDDDKKIIRVEYINKEIESLKKTLNHEKETRDYLQKPEFCENPELVEEQPEYQEYLTIYSKIKNETFQKSFRLNITDFDKTPEAGEMINISVDIEFKVNDKRFIIHKERSVLFSESLPKPLHNSPGWYVGDQHIHSEYGTTFTESPDPLNDMVDESITEGLDWVIFTDHSPAFSEASEWEEGRDACTAESSSSFKCLYGQEMSIGEIPWWCDTLGNSHYLAYPSSDDDLSYINGYCGLFQCDNCRTEQPVVNEISTAGGIGFIAHPYDNTFNWKNWSITGYSGLELINSKEGIFESDDQETIGHWEDLIVNETNPNNGFMIGIAGSDAHQISEVGHTFTYCYLDSETLTTSAIRNAYKNGHCVASTGPFVQFTLDGNIIGSSVNVPSGTNTLSITASSTAEFGDLQWLYIYVDDQLEDYVQLSGANYLDSVDINLDTNDNYIRLEVYTDTGRRAYTNPIWVNVTACSCGSWSVSSCGAGSCNSEQKQWTRTCTPFACATETQCVYDASCEEEDPEVTECEEAGYEFCIEHEYGDCDVSIASNLYENVNNIKWGAVNDAWDPYVIGEYAIGWKEVDAEQMYYDCDGDIDCESGGCDCEEINDEDTMVTITAPGTAHREEILGYDDTENYWCTVWWYPFNPRYGDANPIYVLNCFNDSDCSSSKYCDKSSSWSNWACVNDKSNGQSCTGDTQCSSGYCDNDGIGLSDDGWCFAPYNTYFDGQENTYCEVSTDYGEENCDERQFGEDLNLCLGISYYEEECNNTCSNTDVTSIFECTDAGCSCDEYLCDGLTTGSNITTCLSNQTYFADKCTSTADGEDRGDNICRNSTFASSCTADSQCNGIEAGTGGCNTTCGFVSEDNQHPTTPTSLLCNGTSCSDNKTFYNNIEINCSGSTDIENDNITYFIDAYYNHTETEDILLDHFNNSLFNNGEIDFCNNTGGNITQYLTIPLNTVTIIQANITLYGDYASDGCTFDKYNMRYGNHDPGNFSITGFINPSNIFDGSEFTYANSTMGVMDNYVYVNFSKPNMNISDEYTDFLPIQRYLPDTWSTTIYNLENFDGECMNQNPLQMRFWHFWNETCGAEQATCWNGSNWVSDHELWYACEPEDPYYNESLMLVAPILYWGIYPKNPWLEIGTPDKDYEWNWIGEFNDSEGDITSELSASIETAFNNGACDCEGCIIGENDCLIPFLFHSDNLGEIKWYKLKVTYRTEGYAYSWTDIGNHSEYSVFNWNITSLPQQSGVDLRCRAIDLQGSNNYSDYYNPKINITIEGSGSDQTTYLTSCQELNEPGIYQLQNDITGITATCFTINANNIILDMNGKNITGNISGNGVYINRSNSSTVKNGYIYDFSNGAYLLSGSYNNLSNNIINSNTNGILLSSASNNNLSNNIINDNSVGIYVSSSSNNWVINNTVNSGGTGMFLSSGSSSNNLINNTANSNSEGIYLASNSNNNLSNNIANENIIQGIHLLGSSGNRVINNTANSNGRNGIYLNIAANNNLLANNSIWNCSKAGVYSCINVDESDKNIFDSNAINQSSKYGIWIQSAGNFAPDNSDNNTFMNTNMTNINSTSVFIDDDGSSKNTNNTFINMSYNNETVDSRSQLVRKWYYQAYVNDNSGNAVSGAYVTGFNVSGALQFNFTTNSSGWINRTEVIEYVNTGTPKYYSLYTLYADNITLSDSHSYNVTLEKNNLNDVFTLE